MTQREFFIAVANNTITDEVITKANELIESLDKKNASRKDKPSKKAVENEPIKNEIRAILTAAGAPMTAKAVTEKVNENRAEGEGFATQKISALLVQLTKTGEVTQAEEKKTKIYTIA